jgi:hypothetical protein
MRKNSETCEVLATRLAYLTGILTTVRDKRVLDPSSEGRFGLAVKQLQNVLTSAKAFCDEIRHRKSWLGKMNAFFGAGSINEQLEAFHALLSTIINDLCCCLAAAAIPTIDQAICKAEEALGSR